MSSAISAEASAFSDSRKIRAQAPRKRTIAFPQGQKSSARPFVVVVFVLLAWFLFAAENQSESPCFLLSPSKISEACFPNDLIRKSKQRSNGDSFFSSCFSLRSTCARAHVGRKQVVNLPNCAEFNRLLEFLQSIVLFQKRVAAKVLFRRT